MMGLNPSGTMNVWTKPQGNSLQRFSLDMVPLDFF